MKRKRFSEEQIIGVLKEGEAGVGTDELCRRHGISQGTYYRWKSKYGGMEVSDARRLKERGCSGLLICLVFWGVAQGWYTPSLGRFDLGDGSGLGRRWVGSAARNRQGLSIDGHRPTLQR